MKITNDSNVSAVATQKIVANYEGMAICGR